MTVLLKTLNIILVMTMKISEVNNMEHIIEVLKTNSCLNSKQISAMIYRRYGERVSPQSISGKLRTMVARGEAATSNCGNGAMVYWLIK